MGSDSHHGHRRQVPLKYFLLTVGLSAGLVLWMSLNGMHGPGLAASDPALRTYQLSPEDQCARDYGHLHALERQMRQVVETFENLKGTNPEEGSGTEQEASKAAAVSAPGRRRLHSAGAGPMSLATCFKETATMRASVLSWLGMIHAEAGAMRRIAKALRAKAARSAADAAKARAALAARPAAAAEKTECPECAECQACAEQVPEAMVSVNTTAVLGTPVTVGDVSQAMVVPKNDEFVSGWILAYKAPFDMPILEKMLEYLRPGGVVLDIGANLGTYSIWFARAVGDAGKVWAFEPQPYVFQVLCANVVLNGHRNVHTVNTALSFKTGIAHMDSTVPDGTSKGEAFADVGTNLTTKVNYGGRRLGLGGEKVPMITLDSMNLKKVDFIKMDVQGAEPLVIWGARETIKRCLPVVNFEESWGYKVTEEMQKGLGISDEIMNFTITGFLKELGYTFVETIQEDQFWVPPGYVKRM